MLRVAAPAKINLLLSVLAREAGGFHQIETVFCALKLADDVEVALEGDDISLTVLGDDAEGTTAAAPAPDLGPVTANLAYRAAAAFFHAAGLPPRAQIRLVKRIPHGAGLGGGSSDASAVLGALNTLHGEPLDQGQLLEVGARLGSDVPFFLCGSPLALAWGRGGRLLPLPPLPPRPVLLAVPGVTVATAEAYADLAAGRDEDYAAPPAVHAVPASWADMAAAAVNDFEPVVFRRLPQLAALRDALEHVGARVARMTGTGSVVFGIFDGGDDAGARAAEAAAAARDTLSAAHAGIRWLLTGTASVAGGFSAR
jgi:4-diphosphocytidyl-2-C-methyl-D-erythritol kinase